MNNEPIYDIDNESLYDLMLDNMRVSTALLSTIVYQLDKLTSKYDQDDEVVKSTLSLVDSIVDSYIDIDEDFVH
jgi:hypothetical protein